MCLAVTQRLALPAFDHLIIACFLSLLPPSLADDFTFYSFCCKMQCCVSLFTARILQGFISDIMPPLPACSRLTRGETVMLPFRCRYHTLFTRLIHNLHCVVCVFFLAAVLPPRAVRERGTGNAWHKCAASLPVALMLQFCVKTRETANDG